MKNRNPLPPILSIVVLTFIIDFTVVAQTDAGSESPTLSNPATQTTPATSVDKTGTSSTPKHTISYTVVKGDSLTSLARKFNTTRKKLKTLNDLTVSTVKPGQVLLVPYFKSAKSTGGTLAEKEAAHQEYMRAQPVQDFDIPASTFASCPVPLPSEDADSSTAPSDETETSTEKPAPIARLVSPAELAEAEAQDTVVEPAPEPTATYNDVASSRPAKPPMKSVTTRSTESFSANAGHPIPTVYPVAPQPRHRTLAQILGFDSPSAAPADDWGNRFLTQARALGNEGIGYDDDWRPPGESHYWTMDCSNTTRYLYKVTTGIQLPRTASDQYYYLHLQGKAWDVPQTAYGLPDTDYLRQNLKPGDLLFWENTYRPERQPPITHVMVFLGSNDKGEWIMAGSQTSRGGEHNRRNGGPDIYVFRPSQPCGGYTTWLGLVHHTGRFCAFGRPLEADPTKLTVAENN